MRPIGPIDADFVFTYFHQEERAVASLMLVMESFFSRCTYNTTEHSTPTRIGSTGGDEMCNLYLMFYTLSSEVNLYLTKLS